MSEDANTKEIAALDAIIAASLAGRSIDDLTDAEILKLCIECPPISEGGRSILARLGSEPFGSAASERDSNSVTQRAQLAGMYRQGSDEGLDPQVKEEIDRKREELRARLRAKKERNV